MGKTVGGKYQKLKRGCLGGQQGRGGWGGRRIKTYHSELLDAVEVVGVADGLPEGLTVLDVAGEVADARVKDVVEGVPAEEEVTDDSQALPVGLMCPQPPQVQDGVDAFLFLSHHLDETAVRRPLLPQQRPHLPLVLLDETYYPLPEVLRNVLRLIFTARQTHFLLFFRNLLGWGFGWCVDLEGGRSFRFEGVCEIEEGGGVEGVGDGLVRKGRVGEGGVGGEVGVGGIGEGVEMVELVVRESGVGQLEFEVVDHSSLY